ncbi:MAG TPA: hypothetical protein VM842_03165, partial [Nitrospira sp.]|nr:hypothetical protein [Nitrospira sp.]
SRQLHDSLIKIAQNSLLTIQQHSCCAREEDFDHPQSCRIGAKQNQILRLNEELREKTDEVSDFVDEYV